ncbi:MAG: hypothetical protein Q4C83_01045 [Candidatus Saccharibacteria bacterium]|nr:hypothetical protein [Candidatus Saccharibacteria bacterium]
MAIERNPGIAEIEALATQKMIASYMEWPDHNPDNKYICKGIKIPRNLAGQAVKRAICFALSDLELWNDLKAVLYPGGRGGVFIIDRSSGTTLCKAELDGDYSKEFVRNPRILLMSTTGRVRQRTIWDLVDARTYQARKRRLHAQGNSRQGK